MSSGGVAMAEELFWDIRKLLESLASQRPVILSIDDLQWAEPMLLDLFDHVAELSRGAPILLLCTARPELVEERPKWGGGKLNATTVLLEPLGPAESEALLDELGDGLDPESRRRVIAASEGNPLFLEEMVALAPERGVVEAPSTIQALLAARLERLGVEERALLECGAVEGEVFHRLAIKALADERLAAEVELRLAGLVRKELIRPHPATLSGDEAFRFRHLLIRDAVYEALPKTTRAELHERFARWLEEHAASLVELEKIVGWHLEQAVRYGRELGRAVDPGLARNAAAHLYAAGERATDRRDMSAARNLLERALALTGPEDPPRPSGWPTRTRRSSSRRSARCCRPSSGSLSVEATHVGSRRRTGSPTGRTTVPCRPRRWRRSCARRPSTRPRPGTRVRAPSAWLVLRRPSVRAHSGCRDRGGARRDRKRAARTVPRGLAGSHPRGAVRPRRPIRGVSPPGTCRLRSHGLARAARLDRGDDDQLGEHRVVERQSWRRA